MIINKDKNLLPKFVLAYSVKIGLQAKARRNYKRNREIGLIVSLIFVTILTKWTPGWKIINYDVEMSAEKFEVIDTPLMEEEIIPPPPPITEPVVEQEIVVNEIEVLTQEEEKQLQEEVKLDLGDDIEGPEIGDANLETDFKTRVDNYRRFQLSVDKLSLSDNYRTEVSGATALNLGIGNNKKKRNLRGSNEKIDLKLDTTPERVAKPKRITSKESTSIIEQTAEKNVVILRPPRSSLALTEYNMWNKLSSQLSRLDKRHKGQERSNFKRINGGICVSFRYRDGTQHQLLWQKGGKIAIKIIGKHRKSSLKELERAFSKLSQLSLNF